jgi:hypothetical protein
MSAMSKALRVVSACGLALALLSRGAAALCVPAPDPAHACCEDEAPAAPACAQMDCCQESAAPTAPAVERPDSPALPAASGAEASAAGASAGVEPARRRCRSRLLGGPPTGRSPPSAVPA